jgi:hypothetical protein
MTLQELRTDDGGAEKVEDARDARCGVVSHNMPSL